MPKSDVIWDWLNRNELDEVLFLIDWIGRDDPGFSKKYRASIVKWMQPGEGEREGQFRIGFFPRDYVEFWTRITALKPTIDEEMERLFKEFESIMSQANALENGAENLLRKCSRSFPIPTAIKRRLLDDAKRDLEEAHRLIGNQKALLPVLELASSRGDGSRVQEAARAHEEEIRMHREKKEAQKKNRDARWYALIAAELMENRKIKGTEISRKHGIPVGDVYRLWKPIKQEMDGAL